ncbi:MAG: hypothetical protein U1E29_03805 [Coriobacteriia bacterium]|nr:hypothetical protein [Coriobacteriia bacterium]
MRAHDLEVVIPGQAVHFACGLVRNEVGAEHDTVDRGDPVAQARLEAGEQLYRQVAMVLFEGRVVWGEAIQAADEGDCHLEPSVPDNATATCLASPSGTVTSRRPSTSTSA